MQCRTLWIASLCAAVAAFSGCAGGSRLAKNRAEKGRAILWVAKKQLGRNYKFGGRTPQQGFDCSGLVWWSHDRNGIAVPRMSAAQFKKGRRIKRKQLQPGDLVFFTTYKKGPSHVGVYAGHGSFIHAPRTGRGVAKSRLDNPYWKKRYLGARRYY